MKNREILSMGATGKRRTRRVKQETWGNVEHILKIFAVGKKEA
jgi:hypothetical protein